MMNVHKNKFHADSDFFAEEVVSELPKSLELDVKIYQVQGQEMVKLSDIEKFLQKLGLAIKC